MKAIVSSKALFNFIDSATGLGSNNLRIKEMELVAMKDELPMVTLYMEVRNDNYDQIASSINYDQLFKLRKFLKTIPEQPIVIEIEQYEDDKISIELSQFVATF